MLDQVIAQTGQKLTDEEIVFVFQEKLRRSKVASLFNALPLKEKDESLEDWAFKHRFPIMRTVARTVDIDSSTDCWEWMGTIGTDSGVGSFFIRGVGQVAAHRIVAMITHSLQDDPLVLVCHKCDNRSCVNPHHFFLGTHQDNTTDMMQKGRHGSMKKRLQTK